MAREPDRRSNFFSPPAHAFAVKNITVISLNVTLSNHSTSHGDPWGLKTRIGPPYPHDIHFDIEFIACYLPYWSAEPLQIKSSKNIHLKLSLF